MSLYTASWKYSQNAGHSAGSLENVFWGTNIVGTCARGCPLSWVVLVDGWLSLLFSSYSSIWSFNSLHFNNIAFYFSSNSFEKFVVSSIRSSSVDVSNWKIYRCNFFRSCAFLALVMTLNITFLILIVFWIALVLSLMDSY